MEQLVHIVNSYKPAASKVDFCSYKTGTVSIQSA